MNSFRWHAKLGLAVLLAAVPAVQAQQNTPHVGYVYPAGGRQGTTFEVTVGGQFLDGVNGVFVSGAGVQAKVGKLTKPMTQGQYNKFREQLKELTDKKAAAAKQVRKGGETAAKAKWTAEDEKAMVAIREKITGVVRRPANPAIAELVRVQITMAPDAAPGERDIRLSTSLGLTNPLVFCVDQLPEVAKVPAMPESTLKTKSARYRKEPDNSEPEPPAKVTLPTILNGQMAPGGVDRYKFQATKGQHLVVIASVRDLIPYISDAVPGWFQATLALYDASGKEVDYADHFRFHQDPVLHYVVAKDGEYTLVVRDSIYRGREDFVYRVAVGELPFLTGIFPLGSKAGTKTTLQMKGWNLPDARLTEDTKGKATGVYPVSVRNGGWISNRVPFAVDALPETTEKEPNNSIKSAQRVKLPIIVNGRVDKAGESDVFRFDGRAGEEIVAEVFARRLDSPLDSILKLTDVAGKVVAVNDDYDDKGAGLITHQADSRILAKLPANGTYYLHLGDTQGKGGPEYAYRLRISQPQPDFELRVVPSSINVRAGTTMPIAVHALRRDGFTGDIKLQLKDAPPGYVLSGGWVPASQDKVRLTLTVPAARMDKPLKLHLEGRATISGKQVVRPGVPAEYQEQAFAYHHLVAEKDWMVRITGSNRKSKGKVSSAAWRLAGDQLVKVPTGGTAPVRILLPKVQYAEQAEFKLSEPPEGITIQNVSFGGDGVALTLSADPTKAKPGLRGNLIVDAFVEMTTDSKKGKARSKRIVPLGTLPAISFEVVGTMQARQ